jgi:putative ABC transport system permease protein
VRWRALDASVPVGDVQALATIAGASVARPRYEMTLMALFGALAALLAVIGCYGVMAYSVAQRTREIGVRIALGASRGSIAREVLGRGGRLVVAGLASGVVVAALVTRVLERSLYGVTPNDPLTFLLASFVLGLATMLASWVPARRAAAIEPSRTLREE